MKFIIEEENKKALDDIRRIGWDKYKQIRLNEISSNEPIVVRIKGTISDYAQKNGYINALEAMKIIEQTRIN